MQPYIKFINRIAIVLAILFFSHFAKAQTTDSVRDAINYILAPLNKALVPTGILAENTYPLLELSTYNGQLTTDNNIVFRNGVCCMSKY